jgi:hypothetical protein
LDPIWSVPLPLVRERRPAFADQPSRKAAGVANCECHGLEKILYRR